MCFPIERTNGLTKHNIYDFAHFVVSCTEERNFKLCRIFYWDKKFSPTISGSMAFPFITFLVPLLLLQCQEWVEDCEWLNEEMLRVCTIDTIILYCMWQFVCRPVIFFWQDSRACMLKICQFFFYCHWILAIL